jgi:hypothetical protein
VAIFLPSVPALSPETGGEPGKYRDDHAGGVKHAADVAGYSHDFRLIVVLSKIRL